MLEVHRQTLQELPLRRIDLPIGQQKISDDGERRRSQPRRDRLGRDIHHNLGFLLFEQPFHPIDESAHRLARLPPEPPRGPDQMMGAGQFLPCHMVVRVHRPDEKGDQGFVEFQCSSSV